MGRVCSVYGCQSGYTYASRKRKAEIENINPSSDSTPKTVSKYSFPEEKEECDSWLRALPNSNLTYDKVHEKMAKGKPQRQTGWNYSKADWAEFRTLSNQSIFSNVDLQDDNNTLLTEFPKAVISAAVKAIPRGSRAKYSAFWNGDLEEATNARKKAWKLKRDNNTLLTEFPKAVISAAVKAIPRGSRAKYSAFWNGDLEEATNARKKAWKLKRDNNTPENRTEYNRLSAKVKLLSKTSKKKAWEKTTGNLDLRKDSRKA